MFKPVNDAFGHATGDEALKFVATILSDGTRKMDLLARYGGDEFVVVSAVGGEDEPRSVCTALRDAERRGARPDGLCRGHARAGRRRERRGRAQARRRRHV